MNKTAEKIIQDYEYCVTCDCENCPIVGDGKCYQIEVDVLELAKRQQAEIDRLKAQIDFAVDRIYELLNEYDIGLWRDIEYIDLADIWVSLIDEVVLNKKTLKARIKAYIKGGADNENL